MCMHTNSYCRNYLRYFFSCFSFALKIAINNYQQFINIWLMKYFNCFEWKRINILFMNCINISMQLNINSIAFILSKANLCIRIQCHSIWDINQSWIHNQVYLLCVTLLIQVYNFSLDFKANLLHVIWLFIE